MPAKIVIYQHKTKEKRKNLDIQIIICIFATNIVKMYIIISALVLVVIVTIGRRIWRRQHDYAALKTLVHSTKDTYSFLVNRKHRVKETNFYELNKAITDDQPYLLGNVIHCQNACDSELCGTGVACQQCPIRLVMKNAFKFKRDFEGIVASMQLYDAGHHVHRTEVNVDGKLVYIGDEPHLLIAIKIPEQ